MLQMYHDVRRIEEFFTEELARLYRMHTLQSLIEIFDKNKKGLLPIADTLRLMTVVVNEVSFCVVHMFIPILESDLVGFRPCWPVAFLRIFGNRHKCKLQGRRFGLALFLQFLARTHQFKGKDC